MGYTRETINARIEELRKAYKEEHGRILSYDKIAEALGTYRQTLLSWIKPGKNAELPLWALMGLCDFFNCEPGYLLGEYDTLKQKNFTPCEITGLKENTINLLQEATTDEREYFNKIIGECLGNRSGFYFDMLQEWNETKRLYEEAQQNPHFEMVERIRNEIIKEHPEYEPPTTFEEAQKYPFVHGDLRKDILNEIMAQIEAETGADSQSAFKEALKIERETGHFFFDYERFNALARYRVIDLQNSLAIYLNEDIKQWQKMKK